MEIASLVLPVWSTAVATSSFTRSFAARQARSLERERLGDALSKGCDRFTRCVPRSLRSDATNLAHLAVALIVSCGESSTGDDLCRDAHTVLALVCRLQRECLEQTKKPGAVCLPQTVTVTALLNFAAVGAMASFLLVALASTDAGLGGAFAVADWIAPVAQHAFVRGVLEQSASSSGTTVTPVVEELWHCARGLGALACTSDTGFDEDRHAFLFGPVTQTATASQSLVRECSSAAPAWYTHYRVSSMQYSPRGTAPYDELHLHVSHGIAAVVQPGVIALTCRSGRPEAHDLLAVCDGGLIATAASAASAVCLWESSAGPVSSAALSCGFNLPDSPTSLDYAHLHGKLFAATSANKLVSMDLEHGTVADVLPDEPFRITKVRSLESGLLVLAPIVRFVSVGDGSDKSEKVTFGFDRPERRPLLAVDFDITKSSGLLTTDGANVELWDPQGDPGVPTLRWPAPSASCVVTSVSASSVDGLCGVGDRSGCVHLLDPRCQSPCVHTFKHERLSRIEPDPVRQLAQRGASFAVVTEGGDLHRIDIVSHLSRAESSARVALTKPRATAVRSSSAGFYAIVEDAAVAV